VKTHAGFLCQGGHSGVWIGVAMNRDVMAAAGKRPDEAQIKVEMMPF
jgi:hypothetical protein